MLEKIALEKFKEEQLDQEDAFIVYSRISNYQINGYPILTGIIAGRGRRKYQDEIKKEDRLLFQFILHNKPGIGFVVNYVAFKTEDQHALWETVFKVKKLRREKEKQIKEFQRLLDEKLAQLKIQDIYT